MKPVEPKGRRGGTTVHVQSGDLPTGRGRKEYMFLLGKKEKGKGENQGGKRKKVF